MEYAGNRTAGTEQHLSLKSAKSPAAGAWADGLWEGEMRVENAVTGWIEGYSDGAVNVDSEGTLRRLRLEDIDQARLVVEM